MRGGNNTADVTARRRKGTVAMPTMLLPTVSSSASATLPLAAPTRATPTPRVVGTQQKITIPKWAGKAWRNHQASVALHTQRRAQRGQNTGKTVGKTAKR